MTNQELQTALRLTGDRLHELDRLTEILADVCGAAEEVLRRYRVTVGKDDEATAWLSRKLATAYRAGVQPTETDEPELGNACQTCKGDGTNGNGFVFLLEDE